MTIEELVDPTPNLVAAAARRPEAVAACEGAARALAELRFHEGLRRRWPEARAEAAVREAAAVSVLSGARISVDDVRILSMRMARSGGADIGSVDGAGSDLSSLDPAEQLAVGIWRSQWNLASEFEPINQRVPQRRPAIPLPALISRLHRDICSEQVTTGLLDSSTVAIPAHPEAMIQASRYMGAQLPALACVAAIIAHFRFREVFTPASAAVGAALARWVLVTRGVDPTGVAVISALDAENPAGAAGELAGWVTADEAGVARWIVHIARSVEYGAQVGRDIALHVQAGRLE